MKFSEILFLFIIINFLILSIKAQPDNTLIGDQEIRGSLILKGDNQEIILNIPKDFTTGQLEIGDTDNQVSDTYLAIDPNDSTEYYFFKTGGNKTLTINNNELKLLDDGLIGLGNSGQGAIQFDDLATDLIKVINADLVRTSTSNPYMWLNANDTNHIYVQNANDGEFRPTSVTISLTQNDMSGMGNITSIKDGSALKANWKSQSWNNTGLGPTIEFNQRRGSQASPSNTNKGDTIGDLRFEGLGGGDYTAGIFVRANAEWNTAGDTSDAPSRIDIELAINGSAPVQRIRIQGDGSIETSGTFKSVANTITATSSDEVLWRTLPSSGSGDAMLQSNGLHQIIYSMDDTSGNEDIRLSPDSDSYYNGSGQFGLGTISPDTLLHVVGDAKVSGTLTVDGYINLLDTGDGGIKTSAASTAIQVHGDNAIVSFPNQSSFKATRTTVQSITNNTSTKIQYATEIHDLNSDYDPTTNYRFTVPEDGVYHVSAKLHFESTSNWDAGEYAWVAVYVDSSALHYLDRHDCDATVTRFMSVGGSVHVFLTAGQTVEIYGRQNTGSSLNVLASGTQNYFCVAKIN